MADSNIHGIDFREFDTRDAVPEVSLKLLSYNIQIGMASTKFRHYITQSWRHIFPHAQSYENLNRIAHLISNYDIVALQEADAGSLRSSFINQTDYLAKKALFPYRHHQTNRNLGRIAQHSNGLLSKFRPTEIIEYKLPGIIPGRGAMLVQLGDQSNPLMLIILHLALGQRARQQQLASICEIVKRYDHVIVMGDLNCEPHSPEMELLLDNTHLCAPVHGLKTFPSWRPFKKIDHILVSSSLEVKDVRVVNCLFSDHLPIAMDIKIPAGINLNVGIRENAA